MRFPALALLLPVLLGAANCGGSAGPTSPNACTFTNPLANGQDPWVVRQGGYYYYVKSQGIQILVQRMANLTELGTSATPVWTAPDTGWNRTNVWAPELHYIDGRWYIYYAAGRAGPPYIYQHAGVLQSAGSDAMGPYVDKGMLYTGDSVATGAHNVWAIDLTVERLNGQLYAVWSGWADTASTDKTPQNLYIAPMSDPMTISGNRVLISAPTESWEVGTQLSLDEGPEFLLHGGQTFIIYSTNESWLPAYKLGQLRLTSGADPLNEASWVKSGPVFTGTANVYGVGHASFTTSPDSTEDWIVYHSKVDPSPGWNREVRTQKFGWKADGSPDFGTPVASGQPIAVPSGKCPR